MWYALLLFLRYKRVGYYLPLLSLIVLHALSVSPLQQCLLLLGLIFLVLHPLLVPFTSLIHFPSYEIQFSLFLFASFMGAILLSPCSVTGVTRGGGVFLSSKPCYIPISNPKQNILHNNGLETPCTARRLPARLSERDNWQD
jgi:hypothetical protein